MAQTFQTHARRQQVLYNQSGAQNRIFVRVVKDGEETTPDAVPTITIYSAGGTEVLAAANMTLVTGSDSSYYYDLDTTTVATWVKNRGYRASIAMTISSAVYYRQTWLDVVARILVFDLCDDDLVRRHHELARSFATGKTSHADAILEAEQEILGDIFENSDQHGPVEPDRLVGSEQLYRWHLYLALSFVFRDLNDEEKAGMYEGKARAKKSTALAAAALGEDDEENPDADEDTEDLNFARVVQ